MMEHGAFAVDPHAELANKRTLLAFVDPPLGLESVLQQGHEVRVSKCVGEGVSDCGSYWRCHGASLVHRDSLSGNLEADSRASWGEAQLRSPLNFEWSRFLAECEWGTRMPSEFGACCRGWSGWDWVKVIHWCMRDRRSQWCQSPCIWGPHKASWCSLWSQVWSLHQKLLWRQWGNCIRRSFQLRSRLLTI